MIKKYSYGKVFDTEAVVKKVKAQKGDITFFEKQNNDNKEELVFSYEMGKEDKVYGLSAS